MLYKLHYFDFPSLGEPIKYILLHGNLPWEEFTFSLQEWPKYKNNYPQGQVPVLEFDGKTMYQSLAISRYLAREVGIAGENNYEAALIDTVVDNLQDLRLSVGPYFSASSDEESDKFMENLKRVTWPAAFQKLDDQVKDNDGYLVNGKLSWADFYLVSLQHYWTFFAGEDIIGNYHNLSQLRDKVHSLPRISEYCDKPKKITFATRDQIRAVKNMK